MASKKKSTETTLVTFLLDRSSSMSSVLESTIEAFNGYIAELRKATTPILFTFLQFDHNGGVCDISKVNFEQAPKDVPDLSLANYRPRGGTPLIEAAMETIQALDTAVRVKTDKPKVVVCIQTDGEENSSNREYTWAGLKSLIEAKTKEGWQFNFMGAGIDAYDQGSKMGISVGSTMSYDHTDRVATRAAFAASAGTTASFAAGLSANTSYSAQQKFASGDKFDPNGGWHGGHPAGQPAMQAPITSFNIPNIPPNLGQPLNLTTGAVAQPSKLPTAKTATASDILDLTQ